MLALGSSQFVKYLAIWVMFRSFTMKFVIASAVFLWLSCIVNHAAAAQYTLAQIATHKSSKDCWTAIGGKVYNLSAFVPAHPNTRLLVLCGKDGMLHGLCCWLASFRHTEA